MSTPNVPDQRDPDDRTPERDPERNQDDTPDTPPTEPPPVPVQEPPPSGQDGPYIVRQQ